MKMSTFEQANELVTQAGDLLQQLHEILVQAKHRHLASLTADALNLVNDVADVLNETSVTE